MANRAPNIRVKAGWDDFEAQRNTLQPGYGGISHASQPWHSGLPPPMTTNITPGGAQQQPNLAFRPTTLPTPAATRQTLSLDRYVDLLHLLTGGCDPAIGTWRVKQLSDLERSAVKMDDLRGILAVNGHSVGSRPKQQLLDQMQGMELASPVCRVDTQPTGGSSAALLQEGMMRALQWAAPGCAQEVAQSLARDGFYSYCPLQDISPQGEVDQQHMEIYETRQPVYHQRGADNMQTNASAALYQAAVYKPAAPADSSGTTVASRPLMPLAIIEGSDEGDAMEECQEDNNDDNNLLNTPPEWLAGSVERLSVASQASSALISGDDIVGRKVGIVLLEAFEQGGTETDPIIDTIDAGIHVGQVVEWTGMQHDQEKCPLGCIEEHNYCFVRIPPSHTSAPQGRKHRRRLDVAADLREGFRVAQLEDLLNLPLNDLSDAWFVLEPRDEDGSS